MWKQMGQSFGRTYLRYFLISAVLPILAIFLILSFYYNVQSTRNALKVFDGTMSATVESVESGLADLEQISFTPYLYRDMLATMIYMKGGYLNPGVTPPAYLRINELESDYTMLFTKMLHSARQKIQAISFYPFGEGLENSFSVRRNTAGLRQNRIPERDVMALYQLTKPYGTKPAYLHLEGDDPDTVSLLRTIRDYDSQKELGVLRIDISLAPMVDSISALNLTPRSYLLLIDSHDQVLYSSCPVPPALLEAGLSETKAVADGQRYDIQRKSVGLTGWKLIHLSCRNDVRLSGTGSTALVFLVTTLAFLAALLLYRVQSKGMVTSIESILHAIRELQRGNLSYRCTVRSDQELAPIADALNNTGAKIGSLLRTEYEARVSQSKAEYLALQSQINPHFLYNTLNGFIALNRLGEKALLERSIIQLTKLFRYICSSSDVTTVAAEYDFATRYLELQKLRFEDRITYAIDVSPETANVPIPKLVVQPIVENCIVHGMEEDDQPIQITLRSFWAESPERCLVLEIADTGIGFDPVQIEHAPRVGLKNVMQRLSYFSSTSRYDLTSAPGRGTTVRLILPLGKEKK